MEILSQIFYFIIIIGVLVLVHELGHFLAAKLFRMRVDRFSIGFPPRAFGKKIGETDYCISWLPIGGYVKIAGMIDESLDTDHLKKAPEPWEFRAKPVWQRSIVIVAGVVMNIILAILIFWGLNLARGKEYHLVKTLGYVQSGSIADRSGLQTGDKVISVNGEKVQYWEDIERIVAYKHMGGSINIRVERDGIEEFLTVSQKDLLILSNQRFGIYPEGSETLISAVEPGGPASKAGIRPGDVFLKIDDEIIRSTDDVIRIIGSKPNERIRILWKRDNVKMSVTATPNEDGKIGIVLMNQVSAPSVTVRYGVFEALAIGVRDLTSITVLTVQNIWQIIIGKASLKKSIGGPVKIAEMAAQQAEIGIASFLGLVAILSISLAIINIFPFPALDGGHLIFLIYEAIFRREVPEKIRLGLQQAGMVLLLALMILVIYNDIFH